MVYGLKDIMLSSAFLAMTAAPAPAQPPIKLATWNIEHLAERDATGCRLRQAGDYARLRQFVEATFDSRTVVALQEIENKVAAERAFDPARFTVVMVDQTFPASADACSGSSQTRRPQRVGFAIGKDVSFTRNPDVDALDTAPSGGWPLREGADITIVTPSGSVRLLSVHLKSGCPNTNQSGSACATLYTQIAPLENWIEARAAANQPFVILGDFIRRLAFDDPRFWNEVDDGQPSLELKIAARDLVSPRPRQTCPAHQGSHFIDHVVLSRTATARYQPSSFRQVPTDLSDHCPVMVTLR